MRFRRSPYRWFAVDLFAGAGGLTTGALEAGIAVLHAVNHNEPALLTHWRNHPWVKHHCEDVKLINPGALRHPKTGANPRMVLAAPSCVGHTNARGADQPEHDGARMTAHGVVHVAELLQPDELVVENVEEFLEWIPPYPAWCKTKQQRAAWKAEHLKGTVEVYCGGSKPIQHRAGTVFLAWKALLEAFGYTFTINLLDASEFGVPQERVRILMVGSLKRRIAPVISPKLAPVPAWEIINWESGKWFNIREKATATRARWESGRARFGRRFLMPYYGSGSGLTGRSLDRPIGTVPAADVWSVVDGDRMRVLTIPELRRAMGFPADYILEGTRANLTKQLGNAVPPPLATEVLRQLLAA